jgi:hypothetical protein
VTTPASIYSSTGLSLEVYEPLPVGGSKLLSLSEEVSTLRQVLLADGGCWSLTTALAGTQNQIESWIADGLGRRLVLYNRGMRAIGEYFVNAISATVGTRSVRLGPLLSAPNRVRVAYAPKYIDITPPVSGTRTLTAAIDDATAQARYGIIEKILTGGEMTAADVTLFSNTFLTEYRQPISSEEVKLSSSGAPVVSIECLGYIHWMNVYTYADANTGTQTLSARVSALLAANPNAGMYSASAARIQTNAKTIERFTNEGKTAYALLKEAVVRGDNSYNRWTFGMVPGRVGVYAPIPDTPEYLHEITAPNVEVTSYKGLRTIDPWDVAPAQWVFDPDFLIGRVQPTSNLRTDPRMVFLESVSYNAPFDLVLNGSRVSTFNLNQMMIAMGISGLGGS